jgi:guanylate kinase
MMNGALIVISGPSGAGKSSLIKKMLEHIPNTVFSISTTTRGIRKGEQEGVNYYYVSKKEFEEDIENGMFLEWAKVHENYYGTSLKPILNHLKDGKIVILDIDVQGHKIAREKFDKFITSVFVTTSSQDVLKQRLIDRKTDSQDIIERRLSNAISEITFIHEYDYLVINDDFDIAAKQLNKIVSMAKNKARSIDLERFISTWAWN